VCVTGIVILYTHAHKYIYIYTILLARWTANKNGNERRRGESFGRANKREARRRVVYVFHIYRGFLFVFINSPNVAEPTPTFIRAIINLHDPVGTNFASLKQQLLETNET